MTTEQNPYASPAMVDDLPEPTAPHLRPIAPYISPRPRANFTVVFLALSILANLGVAGAIGFTQSLLHQIDSGYQPTADDIAADTARLGATAVVLMVVRVAAVLGFMFWTYRVAKNLPALGTENPEYTPGWSVGFYFIPILNLFRPYQAMVEIWTGSSAKLIGTPKSQVSVPLLSCWWGVWICSALIGRILDRVAQGEQQVDALIVQNYLVVAVVLLLEVPRDLLSILVVRAVTAAQEQRHELLTASSPISAILSNPFAGETLSKTADLDPFSPSS